MDSLNKKFCKSQINLPFPYPMLDLKKTPLWPFKEEGFFIAIGQIIPSQKLIAIKDLPAIVALNKMGFFGVHSNREIIHKSSQKENHTKSSKLRFTVGFYSLDPIDLPSALNNLKNDMNKIEENLGDNSSKRNQFNSLKLTFEESYFLSYVFGMLKISKNSDDYYTLGELWKCLCTTTNADDYSIFASRFAAYYYFRSQGFVIKNGFKFGVDYLLYEEGPPFKHSQYAVIVQSKIPGRGQYRSLNYNEMSAFTRVSKNSCKTLILCTIIMPGNILEELKEGPKCIKLFKVNLAKIDRKNLIKGDLDLSETHHTH